MRKRKLLFVLWDPASKKYDVVKIDCLWDGDLGDWISSWFNIRSAEQNTDILVVSRFFVFTWELQKLNVKTKVGEVATPGIIILIGKSANDPKGEADRLRAYLQLMPETKPMIENWLSSQDGKITPEKKLIYDAFLSYSAKDENIARKLEKISSPVRYFRFSKDLEIGQWDPHILSAIKDSATVILLLTPTSLKSSWLMYEAGACWALGKVLIPVLHRLDIDMIPKPIEKYQAIRMDYPKEVDLLKEKILAGSNV